MSAAERQRLQAFSRAARQAAFVAGRWLARELLGAAGVREPSLRHDARGRVASELGGWRLSISHSGPWVAVAAQQGEDWPGLDIEWQRPGRELASMAAFLGLPESDFYRHWTLCEAWLKAHHEPLQLTDLRGLRWVAQGDADGSYWQHPEHGLHLGLLAGQRRLRWWQGGEGWCDGGRWAAIAQSTPKSK